MSLFDPIVGGLETALAARGKRQSVITSNLANADTPGYKAREYDFEGALEAVLDVSPSPAPSRVEVTAPGHMVPGLPGPGPIGRVVETPHDKNNVGLDGNSVNRDLETAKMAENQILYRASAKAVARQLALMRYAISEGGR